MKKLLFLFCIFFSSVVKPNPTDSDLLQNESNTNNVFTQEELSNSINAQIDSLDSLTPQEKEQNKENLQSIAEQLKDYKVSGFSFCVDPNFAFIWDAQNPEFNVTFKNSKGEIKTRTYQAKIKSIGLKAELGIKLNLVFFTNTDVNFFDSNQKIKLGAGVDFSFGLIDFTYASFKNTPGGIIILGFPISIFNYSCIASQFSFSMPKRNQYPNSSKYQEAINGRLFMKKIYPIIPTSFSYVRGGSLRPVED